MRTPRENAYQITDVQASIQDIIKHNEVKVSTILTSDSVNTKLAYLLTSNY